MECHHQYFFPIHFLQVSTKIRSNVKKTRARFKAAEKKGPRLKPSSRLKPWGWGRLLPKTNSEFAPETLGLEEDELPFGEGHLFSGANLLLVSGRF